MRCRLSKTQYSYMENRNAFSDKQHAFFEKRQKIGGSQENAKAQSHIPHTKNNSD